MTYVIQAFAWLLGGALASALAVNRAAALARRQSGRTDYRGQHR